jgi:hypothetical protein
MYLILMLPLTLWKFHLQVTSPEKIKKNANSWRLSTLLLLLLLQSKSNLKSKS